MDDRAREELGALCARLDDLCVCRDRGEMRYTHFLSPRELFYAASYLDKRGVPYRAFGGHADSERCRIYLLPDYMDSVYEDKTLPLEEGLGAFGMDTDIVALRIRGSGYRTLTHRDFLGSLLGMGLERSVIGDVFADEDGREALIFCDVAIGDFIERELQKVANDKVRVSRLEHGEWTIPERRFAQIRDTVASPRLDCVIAALCGLSRERAREAVEGSLVEMNFESEDRPDRSVTAPALISVRGYGRYRVLSVADQTKKGRYRLLAEKYL